MVAANLPYVHNCSGLTTCSCSEQWVQQRNLRESGDQMPYVNPVPEKLVLNDPETPWLHGPCLNDEYFAKLSNTMQLYCRTPRTYKALF